jgi:pentatricopeptide repeat protein
LDLLREMETKDISPNTITYSSAISACEKGGVWEVALDLLREMETKDIPPNTITYSSAISACEKGGVWEVALDLLREMETKGIPPNTITYSSAISACEKGGAWEVALDLLREMETKGIPPNTITFYAVIEACGYNNPHSSEILIAGLAKGFWADVARVDRVTGLAAIDLHECSVNVSKCLLVYYLTTSQGSQHLSGLGNGKSGGRGKVFVITGKGKHVLSDGRRGVLREQAREFLAQELGLEVEEVKGNEGCVIVMMRSMM